MGHGAILSNADAADRCEARSGAPHRVCTGVAAHLSEQNNRPELASQQLADALGCQPGRGRSRCRRQRWLVHHQPGGLQAMKKATRRWLSENPGTDYFGAAASAAFLAASAAVSAAGRGSGSAGQKQQQAGSSAGSSNSSVSSGSSGSRCRSGSGGRSAGAGLAASCRRRPGRRRQSGSPGQAISSFQGFLWFSRWNNFRKLSRNARVALTERQGLERPVQPLDYMPNKFKPCKP